MTTVLAASSDPGSVAVLVRTVDGRAVGALAIDETAGLVWTRDRSEVSRCEIQSREVDAGELVPWLHWIDVWEDDEQVWSGPIQEVGTELATGDTRIQVRDTAVFAWYTRVPTTRRWSRRDLTPIAADLWKAMLDLHGIDIDPLVLEAVATERFDFAVTQDSKMLHQAFDELERLGLAWTVVAGRPILGTPPEGRPVAELDEADFMTGLRRVRSGKRAANDVRVQGQNWAHTERIPMAGLRLQAMQSRDNLRGASNITAAARQYLREVGALRDVLEVPSGASLTPDAPITTRDLVPGYTFAVHAGDLSSLMRLRGVEVEWAGGSRDVRITLDAVTHPIELDGSQG